MTVDVEADTTGWDQLTADELAGQLGDVQINSVLNPPTGWTPDDWNGAEGPFPAIEIDTKAKPLNETPAYTGGAVDVPVTLFAGNPTVGDGTGGPLAGIAPTDQEIIITATLQDNASQGLSSVQSTIDSLPKDTPITVTASTSDAISSINAVTETIALVPKSTEVTVSASTGDAVANINAVIDAMNSVYSKTVVLDVVTQYTTVGTPAAGARGVARHGGIPGYAHGGVLFEGGEAGPELAHFATGGTALLPSHALYLAPPHTYISPNNTGSARHDAPFVNIEQLVVGGNTTPADAGEIATMIVNSLDRAIEHRLRGGGLS